MTNIPKPSVPMVNQDGLIAVEWYRFLGQFHSSFLGSTIPNLSYSGYPRLPRFTVAELPSAAQEGAGTMVFVTDSNSTTFNAIVAGGGTNGVSCRSDGTNWRIG